MVDQDEAKPGVSENIKEWPMLAQEMAAVISPELVKKVLSTYGGTRLYIPNGFVYSNHPLIDLIGDEAAQVLAQKFGGESIEIPKDDAIQRQVRNAQIIKDIDAGLSQSKAALRYRLTERRIRHIYSHLRNA